MEQEEDEDAPTTSVAEAKRRHMADGGGRGAPKKGQAGLSVEFLEAD